MGRSWIGPGVSVDLLLAAVRAGQPHALDRLVRAIEPVVVGHATRMTSNRADAEEIAQDSLIVMVRNLARFEGRCRFSTWVRALVRSQVARRYRRVRPLPASACGGDWTEPVDGRGVADAWELHQDLEVALAALSSVDRDILLGRDRDGESAKALAAELRMSVPAVKCRLRRARLSVRNTLGDGRHLTGAATATGVRALRTDASPALVRRQEEDPWTLQCSARETS